MYRLHTICNDSSGRNDYDGPTSTREQELIQRLEEAGDEIEALLRENENLHHLSNELRFQLQKKTKGRLTSSTKAQHQSQTNCQSGNQEYNLLNAVLNDQSRSCEDSESQESEVACVGRKPPFSTAADSRPSKTAYGSRPTTASNRATASQRQSFQRMISRKKKEIEREKTKLQKEKVKIRNWNRKDPSTNPYL